jgi:hypothetical protein
LGGRDEEWMSKSNKWKRRGIKKTYRGRHLAILRGWYGVGRIRVIFSPHPFGAFLKIRILFSFLA